MKLTEIDDLVQQEAKAPASLCRSSRSNKSIGVSQLSSCKAQGYRRRTGNKKATVSGKRIKTSGKKLKGEKYGGPIKDQG